MIRMFLDREIFHTSDVIYKIIIQLVKHAAVLRQPISRKHWVRHIVWRYLQWFICVGGNLGSQETDTNYYILKKRRSTLQNIPENEQWWFMNAILLITKIRTQLFRKVWRYQRGTSNQMPKIERQTIQWPKEKRKEKRIKDRDNTTPNF